MNVKIYEIENYLANVFKKNKLLKDNYSVYILNNSMHVLDNSLFYDHENPLEADYVIYIGCLQNTKIETPFGIRRRKFLETLLNKNFKCTTYNVHCSYKDLERLYMLSKIM